MVDPLALAEDTLAERTRRLNEKPHRPAGDYVLYWMTTALRASENHALERALLSAHRLQKPLVVYHGLSARYAHASDRIHHFILEGEADLAAAIEARGATFVHHLEGAPPRGRPLDLLVERACLVVTDDFPTYDVRTWVQRLAARAPCAMLAVDAACVVPMSVVGKAFDRAFAYRDAVRDRWNRGMDPLPALPPPPALATPLPFAGEPPPPPARLPSLLASLPIDHSVPVAPERPGGERAALARWTRFLARGLASYGDRRNDALDDDGPSGLSPYLHFGMIWAGRVARDARARGGDGAEKFIDELLVWRELAWSWSFHTPGHQGLKGVPRWALDELRRRVPPLFSPSLDALDRGETGDALWDAAQRRLRRDGWLHNNVRMTWGKQIVAWIQDPARALAVAEELNHRYALDGRDPSSYGGILWCFGLFDRPHEPTREMGRVRSRPTAIHARRLPPARYAPPTVARAHQQRRVLVVGAGLAGLTCARALADAGVPVQILEKSVAPGGRLVHRLRDGLIIEDGAPFLHGSNPGFVRWMKMLEEEGLVLPSAPPQPASSWFAPRGVRTLTERLTHGLHISPEIRVQRLSLVDNKVRLLAEQDRGFEASAVVLTAPVPQCMELLSSLPQDPAAAPLQELRYERAMVASFVLDAPATQDPNPGPNVSLLVEEGRKKRDGRAFTIHASAAQAELQASESDEVCSSWLREELRNALGVDPGATLPLLHFKRWRYARPVAPGGLGALALHGGRVVLAGDGLADGTAGGAWSSGYAAASLLLASWRLGGTVGFGSTPRWGEWGCAPGASRERWAARPPPGKGADGASAPRGPLASPGSPFISRHPGETRSTGKISKAPLAHPFGTGPAGLVPLRLCRSFVHKSSRGMTGVCDGWSSKGRAPRVPREAWARGVSEIEACRIVLGGSPSSHRGGAGGCKGAARGASPIGPLAAGVGCASPPFPRSPGAQPHPQVLARVWAGSPPFPRSPRGATPPTPCRGCGLRKPTVSTKQTGRSPTHPLPRAWAA